MEMKIRQMSGSDRDAAASLLSTGGDKSDPPTGSPKVASQLPGTGQLPGAAPRGFEPTLSLIARQDDQVIAAAVCSTQRDSGEAHEIRITARSEDEALVRTLLDKSVLKLLSHRLHTFRVAAGEGELSAQLLNTLRWPGEDKTPKKANGEKKRKKRSG